MNAYRNHQSNSSVVRRALITAMLSCFALAGWFWSQESSPKTHQATAATASHSQQPSTSSSPLNSRPTETRGATGTQSRYVTKNIEDIRAGDYVLAREEHGDKIELRRVIEVYRRTSHHLRHLTFEAEDGSTQTVQTTDEHPVWHAGREEWIEAGRLVIGDPVTAPDGLLQSLEATHRTEHPEGFAVFNFQVDGWHTYFVTGSDRSTPLLVHNADCVWYHGTDSGSVGSIAQGFDASAIRARGGDTRGFFLTKNLADAKDYARLVAKERGGTPIILQASGSQIGKFLDDVPDAIGGEKMIPASLFPSFPAGIFTPK